MDLSPNNSPIRFWTFLPRMQLAISQHNYYYALSYLAHSEQKSSSSDKKNHLATGPMSDEVAAYIAGFLDGDGSIMAQLVRRKDYKLGYQIRVSIVFYQKQSHQEILFWLKEQLGNGYIRGRNDGMSEYTIVGLAQVNQVLQSLTSHLRLKKQLSKDVQKLIAKHPEKMTAKKLVSMSKLVDKTAEFNYSKKRTNTSETVVEFLKRHNLFPVETESE